MKMKWNRLPDGTRLISEEQPTRWTSVITTLEGTLFAAMGRDQAENISTSVPWVSARFDKEESQCQREADAAVLGPAAPDLDQMIPYLLGAFRVFEHSS